MESWRTKIIKDNRKRGSTNEEIEKLVSSFGIDDDWDVVSNPRLTLLEIRYADGTVTVPFEWSYRLTKHKNNMDASIQLWNVVCIFFHSIFFFFRKNNIQNE